MTAVIPPHDDTTQHRAGGKQWTISVNKKHRDNLKVINRTQQHEWQQIHRKLPLKKKSGRSMYSILSLPPLTFQYIKTLNPIPPSYRIPPLWLHLWHSRCWHSGRKVKLPTSLWNSFHRGHNRSHYLKHLLRVKCYQNDLFHTQMVSQYTFPDLYTLTWKRDMGRQARKAFGKSRKA